MKIHQQNNRVIDRNSEKKSTADSEDLQRIHTQAPFGTALNGSGSAAHNTVAPLFIEAASLFPFPPLTDIAHCSTKPPKPDLGGSAGSALQWRYSGASRKNSRVCTSPLAALRSSSTPDVSGGVAGKAGGLTDV